MQSTNFNEGGVNYELISSPGARVPVDPHMIGSISDDLRKLVSKLDTISSATPPSGGVNVRVRLQWIIKMRERRNREFGPELFADPAWDMLLDLTLARLEGISTPVSSLCIAANVPTTTALRWIRSMQDRGIVERKDDPKDQRRQFVDIAEPVYQTMLIFLAHP